MGALCLVQEDCGVVWLGCNALQSPLIATHCTYVLHSHSSRLF